MILPIAVCTFQRATETPQQRAAREGSEQRMAKIRQERNEQERREKEREKEQERREKEKRDAEKQFERDKYDAIAMAKEFVKRRLKAPATADFASSREHTVLPSQTPNEFIVTGYVDAQNAFGAKLRQRYICKLRKVDDKGNWQLVELLM